MTGGGKTVVDGVLVVFHRPTAPWIKDASTVREHLHSFSHHSRHRVWEVNVDIGFPRGLADLEFRAIILHYSIFGMGTYHFDEKWLAYLDGTVPSRSRSSKTRVRAVSGDFGS